MLSSRSSRTELLLLLPLLLIQFCHLLDLMMLVPLGPRLMQELSLSTSRFGWLLSSYGIGAAVAGLLGAIWIDKWERKKLLLWLCLLFICSTLLFSLQSNYWALCLTRTMSGIAGGLAGAVIQAIIADQIPTERRGQVSSWLVSLFAINNIAGIPLALWIASESSWRTPFTLLVAIAVLAMGCAIRWLPRQAVLPSPSHSCFTQWQHSFSAPGHATALLFVFCGVFSSYCLIPFLALYLTHQVGMDEQQLAIIYFVGGISMLVAGQWIGRWADKRGKARAFITLALLSLLPLYGITQLPPLSLGWVLPCIMLFFMIVPGRTIPAIALVSTVILPRYKGGFMAINSTCQQLAITSATLICSYMVTSDPEFGVRGYGYAGALSVISTLMAMVLCYRLGKQGVQRGG